MNTRTKILATSGAAAFAVLVLIAAVVVAWDQTRLSEDEANTIACHRFAEDDEAKSSPDWFKDYSKSDIKEKTTGSIRDLIALGEAGESDFATGMIAISTWDDVQEKCDEDYGVDIGSIYSPTDDESSGPSAESISNSLTETGVVTEDQADCVTTYLLESDLSDNELNSIANDDKSGLSSDEEENVVSVLTAAVTECVTQ